MGEKGAYINKQEKGKTNGNKETETSRGRRQGMYKVVRN